MRLKYNLLILLMLSLSLTIQAQTESNQFVLLTSSRSLYLFDGTSATNITGDEWVVAYTTTADSILVIPETAVGQNVLQYDLSGEFQSSLTDFNADNTPIWLDIAAVPSSDELIAEFETSDTLEYGIYRFDPDDFETSLSFIGEGSGYGSNPDVSSDGRYLVFDRNVQRLTDLDTPFIYSAIVLYDLETTAWLYATSELQGNCTGASWHPAQNRIVYSCGNADGSLRIYVTDIESATTEQLPLPDENLYGCAVLWSPDGSEVAHNTESGITMLTLETMTFEKISYPPELLEQGVTCVEWIR